MYLSTIALDTTFKKLASNCDATARASNVLPVPASGFRMKTFNQMHIEWRRTVITCLAVRTRGILSAVWCQHAKIVRDSLAATRWPRAIHEFVRSDRQWPSKWLRRDLRATYCTPMDPLRAASSAWWSMLSCQVPRVYQTWALSCPIDDDSRPHNAVHLLPSQWLKS